MPDDLLDTTPSDFQTTLQRYDFANKKAKLVNQKAELIRSLDKATYKDFLKNQDDLLKLEELIKQMDLDRTDEIS